MAELSGVGGPPDRFALLAVVEPPDTRRPANRLALEDAFALATATHVEGTLLAGADDDHDAVDLSVVRFRTDPA